jgi:hypothetical protein
MIHTLQAASQSRHSQSHHEGSQMSGSEELSDSVTEDMSDVDEEEKAAAGCTTKKVVIGVVAAAVVGAATYGIVYACTNKDEDKVCKIPEESDLWKFNNEQIKEAKKEEDIKAGKEIAKELFEKK